MEWGDIKAEPGDRVILQSQSGGYTTAIVDHCTRTQIMLVGGRRFLRRSGAEIGYADSYHPNRIYNATPENLQDMRNIQNIQALRAARNHLSVALDRCPTVNMDWTLIGAIAKLLPPEALSAELVVLLNNHGWREEHGRSQDDRT